MSVTWQVPDHSRCLWLGRAWVSPTQISRSGFVSLLPVQYLANQCQFYVPYTAGNFGRPPKLNPPILYLHIINVTGFAKRDLSVNHMKIYLSSHSSAPTDSLSCAQSRTIISIPLQQQVSSKEASTTLFTYSFALSSCMKSSSWH